MSEPVVNPPPPPPLQNDLNENVIIVLIFKVVVIAVFLLPIVNYVVFPTKQENTTVAQENQTVISNEIKNLLQNVVVVRKFVVVKQPTCPRSHLLLTLQGICLDLVLKREQCTPEDFHNQAKHHIPPSKTVVAKSNSSEETRGTIVGYLAAGLLLASLGAALVELYKAKSQTPNKKNKSPLSRKCSLADLTVLKHHRKELVRRESILEVPEEGGSQKQLGGFRPPPLHRRCSFPVGPGSFMGDSMESRRFSIVDSRRSSIFVDSSRKSSIFDSRRPSVIDSSSRRVSLSLDCRLGHQIDGRRISVSDDSPDRRHHTRLVHRH